MDNIITAKNICKSYKIGEDSQVVLRDVSIDFPKGSFTCIMGASGSGKSSLLYILSGLDAYDTGEVYFNGSRLPDFSKENDKELSKIRCNNFSFIFQFYNLLHALTVEENIYLPLLLAKKDVKDYTDKINRLLEAVGLNDKRNKKISTLSGGEQQRVSIIRALVAETEVIFADEPTGNLDYDNSNKVIDLLVELSKKYDKTVILATHDHEVAKRGDEILTLKNGILI